MFQAFSDVCYFVLPKQPIIISAARETAVKVRTPDGQLKQKCFGHLMENYHVVWSPDGSKFAKKRSVFTKIWHTLYKKLAGVQKN
jgi:hypothetical protein